MYSSDRHQGDKDVVGNSPDWDNEDTYTKGGPGGHHEGGQGGNHGGGQGGNHGGGPGGNHGGEQGGNHGGGQGGNHGGEQGGNHGGGQGGNHGGGQGGNHGGGHDGGHEGGQGGGHHGGGHGDDDGDDDWQNHPGQNHGGHPPPHDPIDPAFPTGLLQTTPEELAKIERQAHGSLPDGPLPAVGSLAVDTVDSLRLIAFQEIFEVFYFSTLIDKIQRGAEGFKMEDQGQKAKLLANLKAILAQEELHAINANILLENQGVGRIHPCQYKFPAENLNDAIALASTFTDLVLGALQEVEENLAANDVALIRPVASVIGQEGEQNGYFRFFNDKIPSELPFLTTATREWAWSALNQNFIVPSSCISSDINSIPYESFPKLTVEYKELEQSLKSTDINFSFKIPAGSTLSDYGSQANNLSGLKLVFINQQNTPVVGEIQGVEVEGPTVTFSALFDYKSGTFGNGLTIAVLVPADTITNDPRVVSGATVFGPALIDIN
ncbi:hypothetical protein HYFRA_00010604 [Hymenoscyphus fraxineus]|uniref:Late sexual development protein n=1 Tax=Hymenoscyphus fraxineus TaxID=746836 RepID=A0A9N9PY83_9HELO|nr:hypothetical protein HYFRA_00010604 [Hymenoscyphus fraxineus]